MSVIVREMKVGSQGAKVMDQLLSQARSDHWIREPSGPGTIFLREPMDLGTYYPVEVRISLDDGPDGQELRLHATSEGHDIYYDSHMKHLLDELVSRLEVRPENDIGGLGRPGAVPELQSDLEMLRRLFEKGLLSEREFELARSRAVCR